MSGFSQDVISRLSLPPFKKTEDDLYGLSELELLHLLNEIFLYLVPGYRLSSAHPDAASTTQEEVVSRMLRFLARLVAFVDPAQDMPQLEQGLTKLNREVLVGLVGWLACSSTLLDGHSVYEADATLHRLHAGGSSKVKTYKVVQVGKRIVKATRKKIGSSSEADDILLLGSTNVVGRSQGAQHVLEEAPSPASSLLSRWMSTSMPGFLKGVFAKRPGAAREVGDEQRLAATVKALDCHAHAQLVAVVHKNDSLNLYNVKAQSWDKVGVYHEFQREVSCVKWSPLNRTMVALGCKTGVCLWTKDCTWMSFIRFCGGTPVTGLAWSPNGRLLALASSFSSSISVVEVSTGRQTILPRAMDGVKWIEWSSQGHFLLTSSYSGKSFRIWECATWSSELWADFPGVIESISFTPDGRSVSALTKVPASASDDQDQSPLTLYSISLPSRPPKIEGVLSPVTLQIGHEVGQAATYGIGRDPEGKVSQMCWDPTGQRLAIAFEGTPGIALYSVQRTLDQQYEYSFLGCVWGPTATTPYLIQFMPKFKPGALLTCAFSHTDTDQSSLLFVPMYFK